VRYGAAVVATGLAVVPRNSCWLDKGPNATPFIVFFGAVIVGPGSGARRSRVRTVSVTLPNILQMVENKSSGEMGKPFDVSPPKQVSSRGRGGHIAMPDVM
jgi:hypothetical protein